MKSILKKIFSWDTDSKLLQNFNDIAKQIEKQGEIVKSLSDDELKSKTTRFRERVQNGENLDSLLPEAFAVVREAAQRVLGLRPYLVQLLGGIVLHKGMFCEMKTGEGKTLTATLPAYLNALNGQGVHLVTVNEYLAHRDSAEMGQIFRFLGLTVGCLTANLTTRERQLAYLSDITYGTNSEFGFDYLRDNLALKLEQRVQRGHAYAIIDEVDNILIDEARTPLIIADDTEANDVLYIVADQAVRKLKDTNHFEVDWRERNVVLTEDGITACEEILGLDNLATIKNMEIYHHIIQALKAHLLFKRDVDYVVVRGQEGLEVIIVDQFTGRLMPGRRYVNGLHQAIETKEVVTLRKERKSVASISFQNYFRKYQKLAGMSGTLMGEEKEFKEIYGVDALAIPTNQPVIRQDLEDKVFITEQAKWQAVIKDIEEKHRQGRPVLVGTINIWQSEELSQSLKEAAIPHVLLNAKTLEQEAAIIAQAGQLGAVTIATNMAGRGTDIKLGKGVSELGGLHVIGTTRHDARRIDDQLRGRSGRQGDPGSSCFYISLADDLIRHHTPEHQLELLNDIELPAEVSVSDKKLTKLVEKAQRRIENRNFATRKWLLEFDDVLNHQRETVYAERQRLLAGGELKEDISSMTKERIQEIVDKHTRSDTEPGSWDLLNLILDMHRQFRLANQFFLTNLTDLTPGLLAEVLVEQAQQAYAAKEAEVGEAAIRERERRVILKLLDRKWTDHIDAMEQLRQGIGMRAYGQIKPIHAYAREGRELFERMFAEVRREALDTLFTLRN